jgi:hypothetical protein
MKPVFVVLIVFMGLCPVRAENAQFQIPFGIFAPQAPGRPARLAEETLTIPLRFRESGFRWGFAIIPPSPGEYTWRAVFHLPQPPQSVGSVGHIVKRSNVSPTLAEIPVRHETEGTAFVMNFDKGDPLGLWKIEVFINDKLARTISFQVVEDK